MGIIIKFIRWVIEKFAAAGLIVGSDSRRAGFGIF